LVSCPDWSVFLQEQTRLAIEIIIARQISFLRYVLFIISPFTP
jgi:hypothetical protein